MSRNSGMAMFSTIMCQSIGGNKYQIDFMIVSQFKFNFFAICQLLFKKSAQHEYHNNRFGH